MRALRLIAIFFFGLCLFGSLTVAPAFAQFRNVAKGQTAKARIGMQFTTNSGLYPIGCSGEKIGQLTISPVPLPKDASAADIAAAKDDAADFQVNGDKDGISGKTCGRDEILYAEITFTPHRVGVEKANLSVKVTANPPQFQGYFRPPSTTLEGIGVEGKATGKVPVELDGPEIGPQLNDLVVYRNRTGNDIVHTGVISKLAGYTVVKITSKWADLGLYEHDPNDSIYGPNWTVWRRPQGKGNLIIPIRSFIYDWTLLYYTDSWHLVGTGIFGSTNPTFGLPAITPTQAEVYIDNPINGGHRGLYKKLRQIVPPTNQYNCHGYVFTAGMTYIAPNFAQTILNDNRYYRVSVRDTAGVKH